MDNYNYPVGADNLDAPWNEPKPVKYRRSVFACISFDIEFQGSPGLSEERIRDILQDEFEDILNNYIDGKVYIDDFEVMEE